MTRRAGACSRRFLCLCKPQERAVEDVGPYNTPLVGGNNGRGNTLLFPIPFPVLPLRNTRQRAGGRLPPYSTPLVGGNRGRGNRLLFPISFPALPLRGSR